MPYPLRNGKFFSMLALWKDRKYRAAKDKRDADELIRQYGSEAEARALVMAARFDKDTREERHWTRIAKVIRKR